MYTISSHRTRILLAVVGLTAPAAAQVLPAVTPAPVRYSVAAPAAGIPDALQSWAHDISDTGIVAGTYAADGWKRIKAFAWRDGAVLDTVIPQPSDSSVVPPVVPSVHRNLRATAINDAGVMVGDTRHRSFGEIEVSFFTPLPSTSAYPPLHIAAFGLFDSWAHDVSSTDPMLVVGNGQVPGVGLQSTLRGIATQVDVATGTLGPSVIIPSLATGNRPRSLAHAVNRNWIVVGRAELDDGYGHAFRWDYATGAMVDLGTLGGPSSAARDINDAGEVAGEADVAPGVQHACVWKGSRAIDLGTLGGSTSGARGINARGRVVGWSWTAAGKVHAFVWIDGKMWDLNELIDASSGDWILQYAEAINARGEIVGWGRRGGETQAFVLRPID